MFTCLPIAEAASGQPKNRQIIIGNNNLALGIVLEITAGK